MIAVPHARAAGADARPGRDAGHLGEDKAGSAERALAIMDEMEIVGRAVHGRIHVHRRYDDPVLEPHLPKLERRKHRGRGFRRAVLGRALPEPPLDTFEPLAVAQAQVLVADALGTSEQGISELQGFEMLVALERL